MNVNTITLNVTGMTCMGCVNSVKKLLSVLDGVQSVEVDLASGQVKVGYDATRCTPAAMREAIEGGGYQVVG